MCIQIGAHGRELCCSPRPRRRTPPAELCKSETLGIIIMTCQQVNSLDS